MNVLDIWQKFIPINVTFHFRKPNFHGIFVCAFFHFLGILLLLIISLPAFLLFRIFFSLHEEKKWCTFVEFHKKKDLWTLAHVPFDISRLFFVLFWIQFGLPIISNTFSHLPRWKDLMFSIRDGTSAAVPKPMVLFMHLHDFFPDECKAVMTRRYLKQHFCEIVFTLGLGEFPSLPRFIFNDCKQDFLLTTLQSIRKQTKSHAHGLVAGFTFVSSISRSLLFIALLWLLLMHGFFFLLWIWSLHFALLVLCLRYDLLHIRAMRKFIFNKFKKYVDVPVISNKLYVLFISPNFFVNLKSKMLW